MLFSSRPEQAHQVVLLGVYMLTSRLGANLGTKPQAIITYSGRKGMW